MIIHLNAANPTFSAPLPAKTAKATVVSVGTWTGSVTMSYSMLVSGAIDGSVEEGNAPIYLDADYEDGEFTSNFNKVFQPGTNITVFTFAGTGDVYIELKGSRYATSV